MIEISSLSYFGHGNLDFSHRMMSHESFCDDLSYCICIKKNRHLFLIFDPNVSVLTLWRQLANKTGLVIALADFDLKLNF